MHLFWPLALTAQIDDSLQICFAYATMKAKRQPGKGPKDLPEVRSAEWGTIGELAKNPPPPKA